MSQTFTKLERPRRLPDEIADRLAEAIRAGRLQPGDKLPAEQNLALEFGVARSVVREAISQLRYDGLIEARQGVGAFVAQGKRRMTFRIGPDCFARRQELLKFLQLRTSVCTEAAALAARHRQDDHLRLLETDLEAMQQAMSQGMEGAAARVDAEMHFYATVAAASSNEYFEEFLNVLDNRILSELHSVVVKNAMAAEWGDQVLDEHRRVFHAVRDNDTERARWAARSHFELAAKRLADRADLADV